MKSDKFTYQLNLYNSIFMRIYTNIFQNQKTKILYLKHAIILMVILLLSGNKLFSQTKSAVIKIDTITRSETIIFNQKKYDTISMANIGRLKEELNNLAISDGKIFFTGTGFASPIFLQISAGIGAIGNIGSTLDMYFAQCSSGSRFTMEKCVVTTKEGKKHIITKAIFF